MKGIAILGSTGTIGEATLDVAGRHPDRFSVVALAAHSNHEALFAQVERHRPAIAALADRTAAARLAQRVAAAGDHLPWLIQVEERGAHRVDEAVARRQDTVVDQEPAFGRLDGGRPGADLGGLPAPGFGRHDVAMPAPVGQVRAFRVEDVAERGVTIVTRSAEDFRRSEGERSPNCT